MTRKGDHTLERPHRRSVLVHVPRKRVIVPRELLEKLAAIVPANITPQRTATAHQRVDLGAFIADHAIAARHTKSWNDWVVYVLGYCLFDESHTGSCAVLMQHSSGALKYRCEHESCRRSGWREVREKFEPGSYERVRLAQTASPSPHRSSYQAWHGMKPRCQHANQVPRKNHRSTSLQFSARSRRSSFALCYSRRPKRWSPTYLVGLSYARHRRRRSHAVYDYHFAAETVGQIALRGSFEVSRRAAVDDLTHNRRRARPQARQRPLHPSARRN